jgi:predicted phosphodiesterase
LALHPGAYRLWIGLEKFRARLRATRTGILGEPPEFAQAADELCHRGFDTVIFGHTHHRGQVDLGQGRRYLNTGSWLLSSDYVEIDSGKVDLKVWTGIPDSLPER